MQKPHTEGVTAHLPLAERWRRLRVAYRFCNLASHHILGFTIKLALLAYFACALLFLLLRYVVLPNIDYYKSDIERLASRAIGNPVSIERIYASWDGLRPNLFLGDVVLRDTEGRAALTLPSVSATLSWWSVLAGEAQFDTLELIRPVLDVRRDGAGKLSVAGIALEGPKGGAPSDWALRQRQVVIREGQLRWSDQQRGAPELALANVNLVLLNNWNRHRFSLQATPPASLARPIELRADVTHPHFAANRADVRLWKGELYADLRDTDLAAWKAYVDYPFALDQGKGSVRAWLTLDHARLAGFTADVALSSVSARLGRNLPRLDLARVSGRLSAREQLVRGVGVDASDGDGTPTFGAHGHSITLDNFSVVTQDGLSLPPTTLSEVFTPAAKGKPEKMVVKARALDLAMLAELAEQLPIDPAKRAMLADFAPRGTLRDFSAEWEGAYPAIATYRIKGQVIGLGLNAQPAHPARLKTATSAAVAAMPAIPGFDHLSGSIDASDQGGALALDSSGLVLQLPTWFLDPAMPFDQLTMQARWSYPKGDQLALELDAFHFVQGKLKGTLSGKHLVALAPAPGKGFGEVDLVGTLSGFEVNTIGRFLPLQTPAHLREWLSGALESGTAHDVTLRLRGDLSQFPFRADNAQERARGEFRVAGRIENGRLNYSPGHFAKDGKAPLWPQAEKINGSIVFDRTRMEIRAASASTLGVALSDDKAVVPDLLSHDLQLEIDGSAAGPLQTFLRYVAASPVLEWIGHFTEDTKGAGNARLGLKLQLPLARLLESKVQGSLQLMGNDVLLFEDVPPVQAAIGKIDFNEHGVVLNGVGASFMGAPLALTGGSLRDGAILIKLAGGLGAEGLRKTWPAPAMQRLASQISGATRFTGAVSIKERALQVTLDSTLVGLGLDFPAPANKAPASESMPLHFVLNGVLPNEAGMAHDDIRVSLGTGIAARYQRQKNARSPWTVLRGGVGVNVPAPEPDSGMMVNVNMKSLNVDQWLALGSAIADASTGTSTSAGAQSLAQYVVPDTMAARAGELIIGERKLNNVVVGASHHKGLWQASIDSRQASGYVTWNESPGGQGVGKVTARLSSLIIPESAEADVKDLLESKSAAATIPALDIVAERFELFNKQLGRLELVAANDNATSGREWRINRLSLVNPDGALKASGNWQHKDGSNTTKLNFTLDIDDAGRLLDRFGFPDTLKRGKGKLSGDIAWMGLPYSLDIPSLTGSIALDVAAGQFLKQDPGAAKLLGVLSLQALPRLLKLDFHDVFSEGLAFDGISANAVIAKGVIKTDNLKMHGVAATVLMDGSADIANESTNLHVVVIPEFNLGTGPLVYALAVNPVIGLGSFLAQLFLRAPVMKALTYQMQVTGPWKAPVITKLDHATPLPPAAKKEEQRR
ncbi:MAG: TIGR02099 family protein [Massilia sp.]|nr:TIGR02099 family protein [Massilia sp.]